MADVAPPARGEDPGKWWANRVKQFRFFPGYLMRGVTNYSPEFKEVTEPDGTTHLECVSVRTFDTNSPPEETYPMEYSLRPEFACRPPLGIGSSDIEPSIDLHPADGPAGCLLLTAQHTSTRDRINAKGVGLPDAWRYWIDPQRDDIVMRMASVVRDGKGVGAHHQRQYRRRDGPVAARRLVRDQGSPEEHGARRQGQIARSDLPLLRRFRRRASRLAVRPSASGTAGLKRNVQTPNFQTPLCRGT